MVKRRFKLTPQVPKESDEQEMLVSWAQAAQHRHPELALLYAIPNGIPIGGLMRFAIIAAFKKRGLRPGFPDLALPVARGAYHGLFIEMKRTKGSAISAEQDWWINSLRRQGYKAEYCHGFQAAAELIVQYLLGEKVA